jgi:membrane fusion protein (multidrug efflux system)
MGKSLGIALALLGMLAAAAGGYWYGGGRPSAPAAAKAPAAAAAAAPITVAAIKVGTAPMPQSITAVGSLRSDESVTLRPEISGRITEILFREGQRVEKGATLLRLDRAVANAEVQQARANMVLAQSKHERSIELAGRNFISGQAKDEAKNQLEVAAAAVSLAEAKLAKTELKAPFSGVIGLRLVSTGDYVKEGQDLVNLEAIEPMKVDLRVPEMFLKDVQVGQEVEVALDALPGKSYEGKVIALNPLVDAAGRAIVIRAQVRNQDATLRPGMFARVKLITRAEKDAVVLPEEALVPMGTERFVFRVIGGKAARTKVETGQRRDGLVEILSGVTKGDIVVTAGHLKLREGSLVKIIGTEEKTVDPA